MPVLAAMPAVLAPQDRHRYPGVRAFEEADQGRFFGRRRATDELLLRVLSVRLLLQFAPSGVGKTSLLKAGLYPRLREHSLFPVTVRLNQSTEPLTEAVRRSLKESAHARGLIDPVIPEPQGQSLWDLLAGVQLWSSDLLLLTPVLVFDQFEEVFTLRDEQFRETFGREIGGLSLGRSPDSDADRARADARSPDVKIILSLREEYLGKLEEFSTSIPDLFHERLRLCPLTAEEAAEAIVEPAKLSGDHWLSPAFGFDETCVDALVDFIDGASGTARVIEPLTLQLVCQRAEVLASERASREVPHPILTFEHFGGLPGLENLVENFFRSELQKLPGGRTQTRARQMFEEGLLDPSGKRLMLEEGQIVRRYGLDAHVLGALVDSRLLRREPRNESVFYEISHDRLTDAVAKNRKASLPRWVIPTMLGGGAVMVLIAIAVVIVLVMAWRIQSAHAEVEAALELLLNEDLVGRLREVGLTDALQHVLADANIDETSNSKARALSLRHEGDIALERRTMAEARGKFHAALQALDELSARADGGDDELAIERARTLKRLGSVAENAGQVSESGQYYEQSVQLWDKYLGSRRPPQDVIEASEGVMSLGRIQLRMGDAHRAQETYTKALRLALQVLAASIEHIPSSHAEYVYDLGRAMQVYADAASSRAAGEQETRAALRLARESLRLRPLSSSARGQVGYAAATHGSDALSAADSEIAERLLLDAARQFDELTQWDPDNRRLQRERAAARLLSPQGRARCAERADCKRTLDRRSLDDAHVATLASIGEFGQLAAMDPENKSLKRDVAWGRSVLASILYALGRREDGLQHLDEAIAISRATIVDSRDVESRLTIPFFLRQKAALLASTNVKEALATLDASLHEVNALPAAYLTVMVERYYIGDARIKLLKDLGRAAEAKRLETDQKAMTDRWPDPWAAKQKLAGNRNAEGVKLSAAAARLSGRAAVAGFQRALEEFKAASTEYPFEFTYWQNQLNTYQWLRSIHEQSGEEPQAAAGAATGRTGSGADSSSNDDLEGTLRGALTPAWMARVLSDEKHTAESWRGLYESRRGLTQFLRGRHRTDEAIAQLAHAVPEAEEYARLKPDSTTALFLLSDANAGLGLLRWETKKDGWEEALRSAMEYRERLARVERKAEHHTWIGEFRSTLGNNLKEVRRDRAAIVEYTLGVQACREGLRLAANASERDKARSCLTELAALGYR